MTNFDTPDIEQICIIVNFGMGSKILHKAKSHGITGGTILLGKGTIRNKILEFMGIYDERKEIALMVADRDTAYQTLDSINGEYGFDKPHHGIAFTTSICSLIGTRGCRNNDKKEKSGENNNMYHAITVIVDKGIAEQVIDAATRAGSKGGTIINARGSGIHETSRLFSMDIEPEKEIVMILSEKENTEAIVSSIRQDLNIDEPGKGILYVQDVNRTYGLYK